MLILLLGLRRNERIRAVVLLNPFDLRSEGESLRPREAAKILNDIYRLPGRPCLTRVLLMPNFMLLFP